MTSRELADRPLACVIWDDAHGISTGEYSAEDIARDVHKAMPIVTFGLLIQEDDKGITLASEVTSEDAPSTYRGLSFIPRGMVKELIVLGTPKRPARRRAKVAPELHVIRTKENE